MIRPGSKKIHDYLIGIYLNHHYLAIDAIVAVACEFETLKISCNAEQKIKVLAIFRQIHSDIVIILIIMIIVKVVHAVFGRLTADICPTSDFKKPCTNNDSFPLVSNRLFLEN